MAMAKQQQRLDFLSHHSSSLWLNITWFMIHGIKRQLKFLWNSVVSTADSKQAGNGIQTGPEMCMEIHSHLLKQFS